MDTDDLRRLYGLGTLDVALFEALRPSPGPERARLASLDRRGWRGVAHRALKLQCASLLWNRARGTDLVRWMPDEVATRLRRVHAWSLARNRALVAEREHLGALLADAGVSCVVLKGAALIEEYESAGARPVGDIDLLVRPGDLDTALHVLECAGYAPHGLRAETLVASGASPVLRRPGGLPVDLHWHVKGAGGRATAALDELWSRARPLSGGRCLTLDTADLLVYTSLHLARGHGFATRNGIAGLVDVALLVEHGADLDAAAERAGRWGLQAALFLTLRLAADLLGAPVTAPILDRLEVPGWQRQAGTAAWALLEVNAMRGLMLELRPTLNPPPPASGILGEKRSLGRLARYVGAAAFPPREDLALEFRGLGGSASSLLAYPLHWGQLGVMHAGLLRRPLAGRRFSEAARRTEDLQSWLSAEDG
ncbi:MAG: nucleotidyltransferase family protein [Alphaproteobacteria bacterium]|nr:nucleotidyltransferase family protein [Alphaproteobacteria bacterium]